MSKRNRTADFAAYQKVWRKKNKKKQRERLRKQNFEARYSLIQEFGPDCVWCHFADARALQFDHVNNDGYKDKVMRARKGGRGRSYQLYPKKYEQIRAKFLKGQLQILCANCNAIKLAEYYREKAERNG
jgi:hypothetical protein